MQNMNPTRKLSHSKLIFFFFSDNKALSLDSYMRKTYEKM